jgi:hypothetical protein
VTWWRAATVALVSTVMLAIGAATSLGSDGLYSIKASQMCFAHLATAVDGLPPATPPSPPVLFVKQLPADAIPAPVDGRVGAWSGHGGRYDGVTLTFFAGAVTPKWLNALKSVYGGGTVVRNVVVSWDQKAPTAGFRHTVLRCLQVGPLGGAAMPAIAAAPAASLTTFAGAWGGHTRRLTIASSGRGIEDTNDGCCVHVYRLGLQIVSVRGTLTDATARYRVTSFKRFHDEGPVIRIGQTGTLRLKDGIITDSLTHNIFCSDPAWGATGACGA